jgi:hypothetical protein
VVEFFVCDSLCVIAMNVARVRVHVRKNPFLMNLRDATVERLLIDGQAALGTGWRGQESDACKHAKGRHLRTGS